MNSSREKQNVLKLIQDKENTQQPRIQACDDVSILSAQLELYKAKYTNDMQMVGKKLLYYES